MIEAGIIFEHYVTIFIVTDQTKEIIVVYYTNVSSKL